MLTGGGEMLTERQKRILWAITDDYILTAEPVGSRTISKREGVGFSAATIRNEMADLEEMGYLEQPHTSSGRIPSQKGYRFYVDHLLIPTMWEKKDIVSLQQHCLEKMNEYEQVFQHASSIISNLTNYFTIILGPTMVESKLRHLQIVPMTDQSAISLLITDTGQVHQQRILIPEGTSFSLIEKLINLLNYRLVGTPLSKLKKKVEQELMEELIKHIDPYENVIGMLGQMFSMKTEERVYKSGTTRMLDQPEFRDIGKMKSLLDLIEENQKIIHLLEPSQKGVQVRIGSEHQLESVDHCSIISASYMVNGEPVGTIGVIGPLRMDYSKVVGLVDFLTKDFSEILRTLYGGK